MEETERDVVVFVDDDGNEIELDVIDYFDYEGEDYAVLTDLGACDDCQEESCDACEEQDFYIFRVVADGDAEEFLPADDEKMDALIAVVEQRFKDDPCWNCEKETCDGCELAQEDEN